MKKLLVIFALLIGVFTINEAYSASYQIYANASTKRIPMGTKLELKMASNVTTETASSGDMFSAYLTRDVRTESTMILPKGTIIRGNVLKVTEAKRLYRPAVLYLNFDHVVAPNGTQIPIKAGLSGNYKLDETGGIIGGVNYGGKLKQNVSKSGNIIRHCVDWGIDSGEELFKGGKYLITPFSAVGGAFAGAGYLAGESVIDLFKKGNDVLINKDTILNILLIEPLDVPVNE